MVVFTCCHCGDSVKKNQVEKHYSVSRCRNSFPALTCVDCLKDFKGNEHIAHTSCVTEEERYGAKGFTSKPPSLKGKRKQEMWVDFINKILNDNLDLDADVKCLLKSVANDPGVPKKETKFKNFCINKFRRTHDSIIDKAWKFLEEKKEEFQKLNVTPENGEEDRKRKRTDSSNECSTEIIGHGNSDANKLSSENSRKKNKKKKREEQNNSAELENETMDSTNVDAESKKQKNKNKLTFSTSIPEIEHEDCDRTTGEVISEDVNERESQNRMSKKEKKEKLKKEKYEKQLLEIQNIPVHDDDATEEQVNNEETSQKSKKKKKKQHQENGVLKDVDTTVITASKKKQRQPDIEVTENGEDAEVQEDISDAKPKKFNWEETVVKLLESKGELPLKRVEKKVVNEYINSGVHVESVEKVVAKFNKKILKMSRIKVKKDVVKLVT